MQLLDIMMPGVDGWTVLDALNQTRNKEYSCHYLRIVEDVERGFGLGASDYLVKPILEEELVNSLDRLNSDGSIREVLVVDDNPNDLRLIGKMLTDDGRYKPILAEGGLNGWSFHLKPRRMPSSWTCSCRKWTGSKFSNRCSQTENCATFPPL
ncbi:MAG: hypothetical protein IPP55_18310 [Anaerolineales bacterium]|nr:hypothetical protein [Anaerolineales bacterium]